MPPKDNTLDQGNKLTRGLVLDLNSYRAESAELHTDSEFDVAVLVWAGYIEVRAFTGLRTARFGPRVLNILSLDTCPHSGQIHILAVGPRDV